MLYLCCESSKPQVPPVILFWRRHGKLVLKLEYGTDYLYLEGRKFLRNSKTRTSQQRSITLIKVPVLKNLSILERYVSRLERENLLNQDQLHKQRNARYRNKLVLRTIRTKGVQIRNQII